MKPGKLATEICFREGKKSQVKIGDVREILAALSDILFEEFLKEKHTETIDGLIEKGRKRYVASFKGKK